MSVTCAPVTWASGGGAHSHTPGSGSPGHGPGSWVQTAVFCSLASSSLVLGSRGPAPRSRLVTHTGDTECRVGARPAAPTPPQYLGQEGQATGVPTAGRWEAAVAQCPIPPMCHSPSICPGITHAGSVVPNGITACSRQSNKIHKMPQA